MILSDLFTLVFALLPTIFSAEFDIGGRYLQQINTTYQVIEDTKLLQTDAYEDL